MQEPTIHDLYECRYEPDKLVILIERMHKNSLKTAVSEQTAHNSAMDAIARITSVLDNPETSDGAKVSLINIIIGQQHQ